jgi:hypothetical protein
MGLTDAQAAKIAASLNPPIQQATHQNHVEDSTIGNERTLRGIPVVGRVSGTMPGTRPGDSAAALEQAGRDIVSASLRRRTKKRDHE